MKNKRGQLYIFAALILCVVLFILVGKRVFFFQENIEDDFESLSQNYNYESAKFINNLLSGSDVVDIGAEFTEFTADFTSYSKNKNPDFMLIYAFKYKDTERNPRVFLGNYLDVPILVKAGGGYELIHGCFDKISTCVSLGFIKKCTGNTIGDIGICKKSFDTGYPIDIIISGIHYELTVVSDSPEIIIISKENLKEQRKIYMNDEFATGDKWGDDVAEFESNFSRNTGENLDNIGKMNICKMVYNGDEERCIKDKECKWNVQKGECEDNA